MANSEHLSVVKRGREGIRAWQLGQERPPRPLDLEEANLLGVYLPGANLTGANLRGANLEGANLEGANLEGANLLKARVRGANLLGANLLGANLAGANLGEANLAVANLGEANLVGANLLEVNLRGANLEGANLGEANLAGANLLEAHLRGANLAGANLRGAHLEGADLGEANLEGADVGLTNLLRANLEGAHLRGAQLPGANLDGAKLRRADLREVGSGGTVYADVDLSEVLGLEEVNHTAPSSIAMDTLRRSKGKIPEVFLRGCGLSEWEIALAKLHTPDLTPEQVTMLLYRVTELRTGNTAIQISPLFISYSTGDADFVDALACKLTARGIRFWRDTQLTSGRLEKQIGRAISLNPTFLLVLSKNSVKSDWVEWEAAEARKLEKELRRDVLCPIALDDTWKAGDWPGPLRRQIEDYNVLSFAGWKEDEILLDRQFAKLADGLAIFYRSRGDADRRS